MPQRDVVSWTSLISGFSCSGPGDAAVLVFVDMLEENKGGAEALRPYEFTFATLLQACGLIRDNGLGKVVHGYIVTNGVFRDSFAVNSLIDICEGWIGSESGENSWCFELQGCGFLDRFYFRACSLMGEDRFLGWIHAWSTSSSLMATLHEGLQVFYKFYLVNGNVCSDPDVVPALVQGCSLLGSLKQAKHYQINEAHLIFRRMTCRDTISWNTMISCFIKNDRAGDALELLRAFHVPSGDGLMPVLVTILSSIQACSGVESLLHGQILHGYMVKSGFNYDVFICNALIDIYAKSGRLDFAEQMFRKMNVRDLASWNSMITTYTIYGDGRSALTVFYDLKKDGKHEPSAIAFARVTSACSHSGLTTEGYECFKSMVRNYKVEHSMEHYASVVDHIGGSGKLREAESIKEMPINPGPSVWGSLLGACGLHGNVEIAERAACQGVVSLRP
ncbi:pentatricopeptide repeat-containing protein At1g11290, chloroplastic-like [Typha latifolia]|uniref:pentatricopeptide repeat-containing protein At1g11290, chloroplastic-like n=1 Tax=Typha latifolia TaxID=4733 RepID=UPI003C2E73B1